jgi:hypothetical protein
MEWAARRFYSLGSIVERMGRSRTGLWWNVVRNLGYHLALRNFGEVGFNPEGQAGTEDTFRPRAKPVEKSVDFQESLKQMP